ncbi:MAG: hypothetical protein RSC75_12430, partial [Bacteroidales bacterium]
RQHLGCQRQEDPPDPRACLDGETLSLIKSYEVPDEPSLSKTVGQYLSRIGIRFSNPLDKFIYPRLGA